MNVVVVFAVIVLSYGECNPIRHARHYANEQMMSDQETDTDGAFVLLSVSEVNIDSAAATKKRFIELNVQNVPDKSPVGSERLLRGWRLLMVKGSTMEIVMSIDLPHHLPEQSDDNTFIVIGDAAVPNVDISFASERCEIAFTPATFPDFDSSPFAIILLGAMDEVSADALTLPTRGEAFQALNIAEDDYRQKIIADLVWDVVVVGRRVPTNQCDFFTSLFPKNSYKENFIYLLRDRDSASSSFNDYSLNHCCKDPVPYSPSCFKLGHPSPGLTNDCTGRRFILEFEINQFDQSRQSSIFVDQNEAFCSADFPGIEPYRYNVIHDHDYAQAIARVMQKLDCDRPEEYMEVDSVQSVMPNIRPTPPSEAPKKYISRFDLSEFKKCQKYFTRPEDLERAMYSSWLNVEHHSDKCIITCKFCRTYFESGWRPDQKHKHNIQKNGHFSKKKSANTKAVNDHLKNPVHAEAAFFYMRLESATTRSEQIDIEAMQEVRERQRLAPTVNESNIGYTEIQAGGTFRGHAYYMELAHRLGVDVGSKHRNEDSLSLLSKVFSLGFHKRLLEHLVREQKYFSFICDGTTNRNVPYLVCLIQTLEDSNPIVYFWGLVVITVGETGFNMVEDVRMRVAEDDKIVPGFEQFFKRRIIASVSDSASNMVGSKNSFYFHLSRIVGRKLALVKCGAHKLQRAILHAIDFPTDDPSPAIKEKDRHRYFKTFAHINNKFYTFYMSRGSKRFQEFVELAEELEIPAYRINYFFDVRWAASHKRCTETMYKNYDALRADLNRIVNELDFDQTGKAKALELYKHLVDKTFPVVVAEFSDFLTIFGVMSQRFQSKGGIMIGNVEIIREGYLDFEKLKHEPGSYLQNFLNKCSCPDVCSKGECTLADYDSCAEVLKDDPPPTVRLTSRTDGEHTIRLSQFRSVLYENIQSELVKYFEPETLEAFEVFNPKNFKVFCTGTAGLSSCSVLHFCYANLPTIDPTSLFKPPEDSLQILCQFYTIPNCGQIIQEWKDVLAVIIQDPHSQSIRNLDAAKYWPTQMKRDDLAMSPTLKGLLERILVTSFTSADAERAFSMVSNIKTPSRQNLSPKSLENLVRVRFNGPSVLSDESLYAYTKEFVKVSSRVDDMSVVGKPKSNPEAYKKYLSKSKIF